MMAMRNIFALSRNQVSIVFSRFIVCLRKCPGTIRKLRPPGKPDRQEES
jgi:hypothetical protein